MSYPNSQVSLEEKKKGVRITLDDLIKRSIHGECCDSLSRYVLQERRAKEIKGLDFEGPTLQEAIQCVDAYFDPIELPLVDRKFLSAISWYCKLFLAKFYLQGQGIISSTSRMKQLDLFKKCDKALQRMLESTKQIDEVDRDLYLVYGTNFTAVTGMKYLTKRWALLSVGSEEEEPMLIFKKDWDCACYSPLFKAMILSINETINLLKIAPEDSDAVRQHDQLCNNILSVGRLYQLFNPSKEELDQAGEKLLELLETPDKGGEASPYHDFCLPLVKQLFEDCDAWNDLEVKAQLNPNDRETKKKLHSIKYCKGFARALKKIKRLGFRFTEEDYYLSNKSCPAKNKNFKHLESSLLKSGFEYDPFVGCSFDGVTGYKSNYLSKEEAIAIGTQELFAVTRMITNPSKCKGRGIHLSYNSIQDRCNLIHRVLQSFLNELNTDCTTHQGRGVQFIKTKSVRKLRQTEGYNLYASDFTNATDTLSQYVQELVLGYIFPPEIVEFWHALASMPKKFLFYTKKGKVYYQSSGQPQGFLGSFDAFALVHHVIMLCTMIASDLKDREAVEFYRVLGDDSAICTIVPDKKCPLMSALQRDDFVPQPGRSVLDNYFVLSLWSNFIVNFDKTTVVYSQDDVALIDFAKVTVREGKIFSPVPVRLFFSTTGKTEATTVPGFLWNAQHEGWVNRTNLRNKVTDCSNQPDWFIDHLYFSGAIPCFKSLEIEDDSRDEVTQGRVNLSYILASIQQNICMSFLHDSVKEAFVRGNNSSKDFYSVFVTSSRDAKVEFEKLLQIQELSPEHKLIYALLKNKDIEECLSSIYKGILDLPDTVLWSPYLRVSQEMVESMHLLSDLVYQAKNNLDAVNVILLGSLKPILDSLSEWDKYTFRSDYKKAKAFSSLATTSKEAYDKLFESAEETQIG